MQRFVSVCYVTLFLSWRRRKKNEREKCTQNTVFFSLARWTDLYISATMTDRKKLRIFSLLLLVRLVQASRLRHTQAHTYQAMSIHNGKGHTIYGVTLLKKSVTHTHTPNGTSKITPAHINFSGLSVGKYRFLILITALIPNLTFVSDERTENGPRCFERNGIFITFFLVFVFPHLIWFSWLFLSLARSVGLYFWLWRREKKDEKLCWKVNFAYTQCGFDTQTHTLTRKASSTHDFKSSWLGDC